MKTVRAMGDLTALTEHVLNEARKRAEKIVAQAREEAARIIAQAEERAKAREEELVRAGMDDVNRIRKQIVSQARLKLKGELLKEKAAILDRIIGEVRDRLEEVCAKGGEEYLNLLVGLVGTALAGEGNPGQVVIHLSPRDLKRYEKKLPEALKDKLGLNEVKLLSAGISGGVIIELPDRHLEIDSSFAQLLRELTPKVEAIVQREIFAPLDENGEGTDGTDSTKGE